MRLAGEVWTLPRFAWCGGKTLLSYWFGTFFQPSTQEVALSTDLKLLPDVNLQMRFCGLQNIGWHTEVCTPTPAYKIKC